MSNHDAAETPLIDLLRSVPADARLIYEHSPTHSQSIPIGNLCARAAAALAQPEPVAGWLYGEEFDGLMYAYRTAPPDAFDAFNAVREFIREQIAAAPTISLPPAAEKQDERARFEDWYAPIFCAGCPENMTRKANGEYDKVQRQIAWVSWQAALAQSPAAQDHRNGLPHSANMMDKDGCCGWPGCTCVFCPKRAATPPSQEKPR